MKPDNSAPEQTAKTGVDRRALLTAAGGIAATAAVGGAVWMGTAASQSKASDIVMMSAMDLSRVPVPSSLNCSGFTLYMFFSPISHQKQDWLKGFSTRRE